MRELPGCSATRGAMASSELKETSCIAPKSAVPLTENHSFSDQAQQYGQSFRLFSNARQDPLSVEPAKRKVFAQSGQWQSKRTSSKVFRVTPIKRCITSPFEKTLATIQRNLTRGGKIAQLTPVIESILESEFVSAMPTFNRFQVLSYSDAANMAPTQVSGLKPWTKHASGIRALQTVWKYVSQICLCRYICYIYLSEHLYPISLGPNANLVVDSSRVGCSDAIVVSAF